MGGEIGLDRKTIEWRAMPIAVLIVGAGVAIGLLTAFLGAEAPTERQITIEAEQYAFNPPVIKLNRGDTVRLTLASTDVPHGFYLEAYGFDAHMVPEEEMEVKLAGGTEYEPMKSIEFTADRVGKFRYRCSLTCGSLHPFMLGELIVRPNYLYTAGIGLLVGLVVAIIYLKQREVYA